MDSRPLLTVVIPTYNHARFLAHAVDNVVAQVPDAEIIVVDDGSTDDTPLVAAALGTQITYIRQVNAGPSAARNRGISQARGQWIHLLDADDWTSADFYQSILAAAGKAPSKTIFVCGVRHTTDGQTLSGGWKPWQEPGDQYQALLHENKIGAIHSVLLPHQLFDELGQFDSQLWACEDWDLWLRAAHEGWRFVPLESAYVVYRQVPGSNSRNRERMIRSAMALYDKQITLARTAAERRIIRACRRAYLRGVYLQQMFMDKEALERAGRRMAALGAVAKTVVLHPIVLPELVGWMKKALRSRTGRRA